MGAGTQLQFPLPSLLSDPSPLKITLGGDVGTADGVHRDIISIARLPTPSLCSLRPPPLPRLREMLLANIDELRSCDIFTDGSCIRHSSQSARVFGDPSACTTGAIILKERGNNQAYGFMIHITEGEGAGLTSAYAMELLTAAGASAIRHLLHQARRGDPMHIYSDSMSAVQQLHASSRAFLRKVAHKRYGSLHTSIFRTRHHNLETVHHIFSHPERRKRRDNFTSLELGNYLADAASAPDSPTHLFPGFARYTLTARQLMENLLFPGQWYLGDSTGTPSVDSPIQGVTAHLVSEYLQARDSHRQQATPPRPEFWSSTTLSMAARQFECSSTKRSFAQQTRVTKIIFDKFFHGENRAKGCSDPALRDELLMCSLCGDYDSEEHCYCHCQGPQGENLLQPIRSHLFQEITRYINALPFGPTYSLLCSYRDMAMESSQPQRVWKGCLNPEQRAQLEPFLSVPHSRTLAVSPYKGLLHIQHLFAKALLNIRTQLTSYTFPNMRGPALPPPPTPTQAGDIAALRNQPRITQVFGDAATALRQGGIASRNRIRRLARPHPSTRHMALPLPARPISIVLQGPSPLPSPNRPRSESSSPASPASPGAVSSLQPSSRNPRRIVVSPSSSPSPRTSRPFDSDQRLASLPSTPPHPSPPMPWWTSALSTPTRCSHPKTRTQGGPSSSGRASARPPSGTSYTPRHAPVGPTIFALPDSPPPDPP